MTALEIINRRQSEILTEMAALDKMRSGNIYPNKKTRQNKNGEIITSTYYVFSCKDENQKTNSESVPADRLEEYQKMVDNAQLFRKLGKEYEELANEKAKLVMTDATDNRAKKNRKSR
jgi:hypothetical protein